MREPRSAEEREFDRVVRRWMLPTFRYRRLQIGTIFAMPRFQRGWFQWRLRRAGRRIPIDDAVFMLHHGGRTALVAGWLLAAGQRAELRPVIEQDLLDVDSSGSRSDCVTVLASLGTEDDARILVAYLDWALTLPPDKPGIRVHCQPGALATLLYLDEQLGTDHAQRFLVPDGPWERWSKSLDEDDFTDWSDAVDSVRADVTFASGGDPGVRRQVLAEEDFKPWELVGPRWWWMFSRSVRQRPSRRG